MATTASSSSGAVHTPSHSRDGRENGARPTAASSADAAEHNHGDPMDLSPGSTSVRPSPSERGTPSKGGPANDASSKSSGQAMGAAAAGQQPKIVQTAFIHKLYNMLEDMKIQHLISWSSSNESFVINPSSEFSKVLATYFKHTNISSFVRQLNMYGFHKVSDVFSTATPDTPLWEFKHGEGNFKRGDLNGLREIKRRASKHALIHRDSVPAASKATAQAHVINADPPPDSSDARINLLEQSFYDMHARLTKSEEANAVLAARYHDLADKLVTSYQNNHDLSGILSRIYEDPEHPARRESLSLQRDIGMQIANIRDGMHPSERSPRSARLFDPPLPASPRQAYYDERRRASIQTVPRHMFRPLAPSTHRHGSLGTGATSPSSARGLAPPPPPPLFQAQTPPPVQPPTPSISVYPPQFPRRHTSADIHSDQWPPGHPSSPRSGLAHDYVLPNPASPSTIGADQQIRDKLASYSFASQNNSASNLPSHRGSLSHQSSRGPSPPLLSGQSHADGGWPPPPAVRMPFRDVFKSGGMSSQNSSAAPTRRSSMANIQAMLNPADTAETEEEYGAEDADDMRKRKRIG